MRIYIAYKFRYVTDKKQLKAELQDLSDYFTNLGHTAFILGRDIQKWQNHQYTKLATTLDIIKNIWQYDTLFVYINSPVHTNGMPVEIILAKLFGLKIITARQRGIKPDFFEKRADKVVEFENIEDLLSKNPLN